MARPRRFNAVIIHDIGHARAAFRAAAEAGCELRLLTPPGGARYAGPAFYREIVRQAADERPEVRYRITLDCDADAALALGALSKGWTQLVLGGKAKVGAKIKDVAGRMGATILRRSPAALDLSQVSDPASACRVHFGLEQHSPG